MNIAYVSTNNDSHREKEVKQIKELDKCGIEKWFVERLSGSEKSRPLLRQLIDFAKEGDTIYCCDISRINRSLEILQQIKVELRNKGVKLVLLNDSRGSDTRSALKELINELAVVDPRERHEKWDG